MAERIGVVVNIAIAAGAGVGGVTLFRAGRSCHDRRVIVSMRRRVAGILCAAASAHAVLVSMAERIGVVVNIAVAAGAGVGGVTLFRAGGRCHDRRVIVGVRFFAVMDGRACKGFIKVCKVYCAPLCLAACVIHVCNFITVAERGVAYCLNVLREAYACEHRALGERIIIDCFNTWNY